MRCRATVTVVVVVHGGVAGVGVGVVALTPDRFRAGRPYPWCSGAATLGIVALMH